jgi:hypothetical protein
MEVKQAVRKALDYVRALFDEETTSNLGLEEVEYLSDSNLWQVTIGFSRPWDYPNPSVSRPSLPSLLDPFPQDLRPSRSYKTVLVDDASGKVVSIRNRAVSERIAS